MKYLCLGYLNPESMDARPKTEIDAVMSKCGAQVQVLYNSGHLIVDAGLEPKFKVLRQKKGKQLVTDGPFAETREQLGSAFIIEANDMDEAVRIASLHPAAALPDGERFGWAIEIRPISVFEQR